MRLIADSRNAGAVREALGRITLGDSLRDCSMQIRICLERVLEGRQLTAEEGYGLANAAVSDILAIAKTADELRRRAKGEAITYVVNRNLNFTNVCYVGCSFCGFGVGAHSREAYFHPYEKLLEKAREAADRGATEVCIQGGLPRDIDGFYYRDLLRALKSELPQIHCHAFSPMEIAHGMEKTRLPAREYLAMLKEAGLGSIPGTAAEILDDGVRARLSPNKLKVSQWVEIISTAHELGIPTTSTMMYGHVEQPEHWVRHILLLREIQLRTGGFTEFVPLGFIHSNTRLYQLGSARAGATLREHLIVHALGRILLHGAIDNIQVSWVKLGAEISLACLEAGANDFGGTLMEESISKAAGADHGEYVVPEEFQRLIRSIGRAPAERSSTYKILRTFREDLSELFSDTRKQDDAAEACPTLFSRAGD